MAGAAIDPSVPLLGTIGPEGESEGPWPVIPGQVTLEAQAVAGET